MLTRHPMAAVPAEEIEWYASDDERVIATIFRDTTDDDYCYLLLARDEERGFVHTVFHEVESGRSTETWGEGISIFHNPNALRPLPEELFPSVAHHQFIEGQIRSHIPEFHPSDRSHTH